jgi:hypothetical protein
MFEKPDLSYLHSVALASLTGRTIGAYFDRITERFSDRESLVAGRQAVRWTSHASLYANQQ